MKYRLNQLPVKTTNGFKINDVELDLSLPKLHMNHEFVFEGDISSLKIQKQLVQKHESSKIGLEYDEYYDIQICIPKGIQIEKPVFIHYYFEEKDSLYSKITFHYEEDSSCHFIMMMESNDSSSHFNHLVEKVVSNKNSQGTITYINLLNKNSLSFYALENDVLEQATTTHTIVDLGGKTRVYNVYSNASGEKSSNILNTIYVGKNDFLLDFNYYLNNIGCDSHNQMRVEGVLDDTCQKNFRGTIDFVKGCTNAIGEENENCILLSDTCRSRSLPQMLCGEESVIGTHGVSSGKVAEEKLFYLMSRGLSFKEAEQMIVMGNFMSLLNVIPQLEIQERLFSAIEELLM